MGGGVAAPAHVDPAVAHRHRGEGERGAAGVELLGRVEDRDQVVAIAVGAEEAGNASASGCERVGAARPGSRLVEPVVAQVGDLRADPGAHSPPRRRAARRRAFAVRRRRSRARRPASPDRPCPSEAAAPRRRSVARIDLHAFLGHRGQLVHRVGHAAPSDAADRTGRWRHNAPTTPRRVAPRSACTRASSTAPRRLEVVVLRATVGASSSASLATMSSLPPRTVRRHASPISSERQPDAGQGPAPPARW